jgi:hypothetical protein
LVLDKRVIDGFKVSIAANVLIVKYQGEIMLKDVYKGDFEGEIDQRMKDISSFLKKEYKKITGNSLTLTKEGEADVLVQSISKVRSVVNATQKYKIGGIPDEPSLGATADERLSTAIKDWIGFGKDKYPNTKNPSNVKGKRDEEPRE